jgi:type I restriction enzyme R subunit
MSTGVDAQTCKLIVLDQRIQSMTEFKQIIGRGTRINEDFNKFYFTIMDFKKATELFADPDFDGDPVMIYTPKENESPVPPDEIDGVDMIDSDEIPHDNQGSITLDGAESGEYIPGSAIKKFVVANVEVSVSAERVQYFDASGKLIVESLKDYTKKTLTNEFSSLDAFLSKWSSADKKQAVITELENEGVFFEALYEEIGKDLDPFDIVCHVAWDKPPLTRKERAENVRKRNYFTKYGEKAQKVLAALLDKYADEGVVNIEETQILTINPFTEIGTPIEIIKSFGGIEEYESAVAELERALYLA